MFYIKILSKINFIYDNKVINSKNNSFDLTTSTL